MKIFLILLAIFVVAFCDEFKYESHALEEPKSFETFSGRLQNGNEVESAFAWPFVVELRVVMGAAVFTCTGSIINMNFVITARSCGLGANSVTSWAGSHTAKEQRFQSFGVRVHFISTEPTAAQPNFCLVETSQNFPLGPTIQIIRLPTSAQSGSFFEMTGTSFAGWGTEGLGANEILQFANGQVTSQAECQPNFVPGLTIYEICMRGSDSGTRLDSGDRGGPVIVREADGNTLIGVLDRTVGTIVPDIQVHLLFRIGQFWAFIHDTANIQRRP